MAQLFFLNDIEFYKQNNTRKWIQLALKKLNYLSLLVIQVLVKAAYNTKYRADYYLNLLLFNRLDIVKWMVN